MTLSIAEQVAKLGDGPLTEAGLKEHVWPLFSRALERDRQFKQIYLASHSLGRPLDQTAHDVMQGVDMWYSLMDEVWDDDAWPAEIERFRSNIARLIGISDPKAVVPKTSSGQGLRAVLNALPVDGSIRPLKIVATRGEFDSVDFILKVYAEKGRADVRWIEPTHPDLAEHFEAEAILDAIEPGVDLVVLSQVVFATGQVLPGLREAIDKAHSIGAMVLLDGYHSVGVMPVSMEALGADFMIGGSYKYARGGPGACWLAIHPQHLNGDLRTLDTGWFAKKSPFRYERPDFPERAAGGDAWLESTPSALVFYQARAGQEFTLEIGVERLREYNLNQRAILNEGFARHGVSVVGASNPESHGAFALVPDPDPFGLAARLLAAGVNTDSRGAGVRFGPDLMNSREELERAAELTGAAIAEKAAPS